MNIIKINLDSLVNDYRGISQNIVEQDWIKYVEDWNEHKFNDIHILIQYLKLTEVMKILYNEEMFYVDSNTLLKWVTNAFNCKVDFKNLEDVNFFNIKTVFDFKFSNKILQEFINYACSEENLNNMSILRTLLIKNLEISKDIRNDSFDKIFKKYNIYSQPESLIPLMAVIESKKTLEGCFKLIEDLKVNINWSGLTNSKFFNEPISNLNSVFIKYLVQGKSIIKSPNKYKAQEYDYFDFYSEKRTQLLEKQSKEDIKNDFKFFLSVSNVPKEEFLISAIKKWPNVTLTKDDMMKPIRNDISLQRILLGKKNWRTLEKYSEVVSLSETEILSANIRSNEVELGRTVKSVIKLLVNSDTNNDWSILLKSSLINDKQIILNSSIICNIFGYKNNYNISQDLRGELQSYLQLYINEEDQHKSQKLWENFSLATLNNITECQWLANYKDSNLLINFYREHIKILGHKSLLSSNSNTAIFTSLELDNNYPLKFKKMIASLSVEDKKFIIKDLNDYWNNNNVLFYENYVNKLTTQSTIVTEIIGLANVISNVKNYIIWLNPTLELNAEIKELDEKFTKYTDFFAKILEKKHVLFLSNDHCLERLENSKILWEEMIVSMMVGENKVSVKKTLKF